VRATNEEKEERKKRKNVRVKKRKGSEAITTIPSHNRYTHHYNYSIHLQQHQLNACLLFLLCKLLTSPPSSLSSLSPHPASH
jgi:hypothetical protein